MLITVDARLIADEQHADDHEAHHHQHPLNSIGLSLGYFYLEHEEESAAGLHLHYMRRLEGGGVMEHLGIGIGLETIFAEDMHHNPMLTFGIYPWRGLEITISPGILFAKHEGHRESHFSTHVEAVYGFHFEHFEVGPVIGFSQAGDDRHFSAGVHFSKGF